MGKAVKVTIEVDEKALFKATLGGGFKESLDELTEAIDNLTVTRTELFRRAWADFDWMTHRVTMQWDCEQSPIGYCIYDSHEDPALDDCVFCHQPHERK